VIVAVDVGRNEVKATNGKSAIQFKSAVGMWHQRKISSGGDYEVIINNTPYFVADLVKESYAPCEMATESKIHNETFVLFLTALSLLGNPNEEMRLITGLPVAQHSPETKQAMQSLLAGLHKVSVNGDSSLFQIAENEIDIAIESGGAYWDEVLDDKGKIVNKELLSRNTRVIDIGSRTVNYITVQVGGQFLDRDSGSLQYGMIEVSNMTDQPTEYHYEAFARRIYADLSKRWLNFNESDMIMFTGGGSIRLKPYFKQLFRSTHFSSEPVFGNSRGYYKMGLAKYGA